MTTNAPAPADGREELPDEAGFWKYGDLEIVVARKGSSLKYAGWLVRQHVRIGGFVKDLPCGGWQKAQPAPAPAESGGEGK